jgi:hypothetical protein
MTTTTADRSTLGYALAHDEGEAFWIADMLQTVKVGRADTGGRGGLIEVPVPPSLGSRSSREAADRECARDRFRNRHTPK